jgi:hypothetical protein
MLNQRELHHDGPVIGKIAAHHVTVEHAAARREENEIEAAPRPRRREGADALRRMEGVVALQGEILKQRRRCIHPVGGVVQVAAKNGLGRPFQLTEFALGVEVLHELANLPETMGFRPIVQVEINNGQQVSVGVDLSVQESLFADLVGSERDVLPRDDGMARQDRVAIVQLITAGAPIVHAKYGVWKVNERIQVLQVIEAAAPARILVDFLEGDDVGLKLVEELRDLLEVALEASPAVQPLERRQPTAVRDIERHDPIALHQSPNLRRLAG